MTDAVFVFDTDVDVVAVPLPDGVLVCRGDWLDVRDANMVFVFRGLGVYVTVCVK